MGEMGESVGSWQHTLLSYLEGVFRREADVNLKQASLVGSEIDTIRRRRVKGKVEGQSNEAAPSSGHTQLPPPLLPTGSTMFEPQKIGEIQPHVRLLRPPAQPYT